MKIKLFFIGSFLLLTFKCKSQVVVNDININTIDSVSYCEILGYDVGLFKKNLQILVDYGQKLKYGEYNTIKDGNGKTKSFNSMVDALNFMEVNGWAYISSYALSVSTGGSVYHFLLKKK